MAPNPQLSSQHPKPDERFGTAGISSALDFDPDAVDFEPLLVSDSE